MTGPTEPGPSNACDCPACRVAAIIDPEGHPDRLDYLAQLIAVVWTTAQMHAELGIPTMLRPPTNVMLFAALAHLDEVRQVPESAEVRQHRETN